MEREIIIRDYAGKTTKINVEKFENVLKIDVTVISGDEILRVLYEDLSEITYDSSDCRIMDFYDGYFSIYKKGKLDLIDKFSKRISSYDEI